MLKDILQIKQQPSFKNATLLGVGPMSVNCVNATIELANEKHIPIILIASRRQIDSEEFGGGYVNNWTTEKFCEYVSSINNNGYVFLARDHGGPWQSEIETSTKMNLEQAMLSAKNSFAADIKSGMNIIHIDPARTLTGFATISEYIERTKELIVFCNQTAIKYNKKIYIEIGTDEGFVGKASFNETRDLLHEILDFCKNEKLPKPAFMVVQTGTKVMETKNVGILDNIINEKSIQNHAQELQNLIKLCAKENLLLKEHNADYLSNKTLAWHKEIGIDSANIAPEFGVIETKTILKIFKEKNLNNLTDRFIELAYNSGKWKKWMLDNTNATDYDRAIIAGHYIFAHEDFKQIKEEAQIKCDFNIDTVLKNAVKNTILNCVTQFGLVN